MHMKRRASIFGTLAVAAILAMNPGSVCRVVSSARNVQRTFRDLRNGGASLNPVERLVFSLVLANTKAGPVEVEGKAGTAPRT
jgi:hypothetical protein